MAIVLLGVIVGVLVASNNQSTPTTSNYLVLMSNGSYSVFGRFFKQMLIILVLYLVVLCPIFYRKLKFLSYIVLFFLGYTLGGSAVSAIQENTAFGIVYLIIYLIPYHLLMAIMLTVLIACMAGQLKGGGCFRRCSVTCRVALKKLIIKFAYSYMVLAILLIPIMIILPCIAQAVIVV